tara:strand:+ start:303 stop:542 length:240 start_codon:yes stop_codon:yes gene_type:complete
MMLIIALVPIIAVNIDDKIPITNVTAKPFTTPVPMVNNAIAAIRVVIFASEIVENALLYPETILALGLFPLNSSSLIRS